MQTLDGNAIAGVLNTATLLLVRRPGVSGTHRHVRGKEWWWLLAAVGFGGVLGPLALFHGLRWSSGYVAGLLLNFEAVFTASTDAQLIAEAVGRPPVPGVTPTVTTMALAPAWLLVGV